MGNDEKTSRVIGANDVSNYVVCPEAWRLKQLGFGNKPSEDESEGRKLREEWAGEHDLSTRLKSYAKIAYLLLVALVIVVFFLDQKYSNLRNSSNVSPSTSPGLIQEHIGPWSLPSEVFLPLIILGVLIFVWDLFDRQSRKSEKRSGFKEKSEVIALKGSDYLPAQRYFSPKLGLSSKPDALIRDGDFIIPVDRKPLGKQVRDRHVVQLLMHMRLIEEIEGKRPPYGMLLLGAKVRAVKIQNTEQKQRWLDSLLEEMWSVMDGVPAAPAPSHFKCRNCDVREHCKYSAYPGMNDK